MIGVMDMLKGNYAYSLEVQNYLLKEDLFSLGKSVDLMTCNIVLHHNNLDTKGAGKG